MDYFMTNNYDISIICLVIIAVFLDYNDNGWIADFSWILSAIDARYIIHANHGFNSSLNCNEIESLVN